MSEKLTRLRLPGQKIFPGIMDWGEKTAEQMICIARRHAARLRAEAEAIESAADSAFQIDVVRGSAVQHHVREVQSATPEPAQ
jgi:hypothetical protein